MEIEWLSSFLDYIKTGIDKRFSEYIISLNGKKALSYQIALCVLAFPLKMTTISSIASEIDDVLSSVQVARFDELPDELIDGMSCFRFPIPSEINTSISKTVNISPKYLLKPDLLEKAKNPQKLLRRQLITLAAALCRSGDGNGRNNQCSYIDYLLFRMSPEVGAGDILMKSVDSGKMLQYMRMGNAEALSEVCDRLSDDFLYTRILKECYFKDRSVIEEKIQKTISVLEMESSHQVGTSIPVSEASKDYSDFDIAKMEGVQGEEPDGTSTETSDGALDGSLNIFSTKDELLEYVANSKFLNALYHARNEKKPMSSSDPYIAGGKYIADIYYDEKKRSWTLKARSNSITAMMEVLDASDFKHIRSGHDRCTPQMLARVFNITENTAKNYSSQINRALNL